MVHGNYMNKFFVSLAFSFTLAVPAMAGGPESASSALGQASGAAAAPQVPKAVFADDAEKVYEYNNRVLEDPVIEESSEPDALILKMDPPADEGAFMGFEKSATLSLAQRFIKSAEQDIDIPYRLGGDGIHATDCGMFTRMSLIRAKLAGSAFPRCADDQYRLAEQGKYNLTLVKGAPRAGDLVFINWHTGQSSGAYKGITHVGIYMGAEKAGYIWVLHASSGKGKVTKQWVNKKAAYAYGRLK